MRTYVGDRFLDIFFINAFVIGAIISGNVSIPFYLAIGWVLCRAAIAPQLAKGHAEEYNRRDLTSTGIEKR
jgi:hypothetical protein